MTIHTFGDSHSKLGWEGIHNLSVHHLGAKLCYSFGRDGIDLKNFKVEENDTVIFCYGEIDCRCHIQKYLTNDTDYINIIDKIVDEYFKQIKFSTSCFNNIKICVYNVVPAVEKEYASSCIEFPYLGTNNERKQYVLYFNKKLKEKCSEYGYIFFDIYNKYIDDNGFLNRNLSDDSVHIRDGIFIRKFLDTI
jgi:hypothetical protein